MQDIVEKILNEGEEDFSHTVDLQVYVDGLEDGEEPSYPSEVDLRYSIEADYRSWGIKGIEVSMRGTVEFEIDILDVDDNVVNTTPITIDFSDFDYQISWMKGAGYVPESLEIDFNAKEQVVTRVEVNFFYIAKE